MHTKRSRISKSIYFIIGVSVLIIIGGLLFLRFIRKSDSSNFIQKYLGLNNNQTVEILEKLNDDWEIPDGYTIEYMEIDGMDVNWIYGQEPSADQVILQLHGGAYQRSLAVNGTNYQRAAVKYAQISGAKVLTIDYRVAPEHPYPAALEDALLAYQWLLDNGYEANNIILVGDSAGGGLVLGTTLYLRDHDQPMPAALVTMSAWTNLDYKRVEIPYVGNHDAKEPYISPIYGDFTGFPPMLMQVGGDEKLLKDTTEVAHKAKEAGVDVKQSTYDGMFHVFQLLYPVLPEANEAWDEVEDFINLFYE